MKKHIIYTISLLFCTSIFAQLQTVNKKTRDNSQDLTGKYFKDIDGDFDPFIGTWKGTINNKTMIINISKEILGPISKGVDNYAADVLAVDIKIIQGEGTTFELVLCDTATEYSQFPKTARSVTLAESFNGVSMSGKYEDHCHPGNSAGGIVKMTIQNPQAQTLTAHWEIKRKGLVTKSYPGEPVFVTPTDIILTKQP